MKKQRLFFTAICIALLSCSTAAYASLLPYNNTFVHVANDMGTRYAGDQETFGAPAGSYYAGFTKGEGKGLNSIYLTSSVVNTTTGSASGTFYITDTGGSGYSDNVILLLSATGPISSSFSANIQSSGWVYPAGTPENAVYQSALNETFTKTDFIYGPQTYRISSYANYPFYAGQDMSDPSTSMYFMLVDLYVGTLSDQQPVAVTYSLSGLDTQKVAFNAYAWRGSANAGSGINWTNSTGSSYLINSAPAPVPIPPALFLFGSGLAGIFFVRKRSMPAKGMRG
jgi:hypothetical protein